MRGRTEGQDEPLQDKLLQDKPRPRTCGVGALQDGPRLPDLGDLRGMGDVGIAVFDFFQSFCNISYTVHAIGIVVLRS